MRILDDNFATLGLGFAVAAVAANPYADNAFRVLALTVGATSRESRRRGEERLLHLELGGANPEEIQRIRRAMATTEDPVSRLAEELYWVHLAPDPIPPDIDLADGQEVDRITRLLASKASEGADQALHDIAVLLHASAIEGGSPGIKPWRLALECWRETWKSNEFWFRMGMRAEDLHDPRLTQPAVDSLRADLPRRILAPSASMVARLLDARCYSDASRHMKAILESGFPAEAVAGARIDATSGLCAQIRGVIADIRAWLEKEESGRSQSAKDSGKTLNKAITRARREAESPIMELKKIDGEAANVQATADEAAIFLRLLSVQLHNRAEDTEGAITLLEVADDLAGSEHVKRGFAEDIRKLRYQLAMKRFGRFFEAKQWEMALSAAREAHELAADDDERRQAEAGVFNCRQAMSARNRRWIGTAVTVTIIAVGILLRVVSASSPVSKPEIPSPGAPPTTSTPRFTPTPSFSGKVVTPLARTPTPRPSAVPTSSRRTDVSNRMDRLREEIERERPSIEAQQSQLGRRLSNLDALRPMLDQQEGELNRNVADLEAISRRYSATGAPPDVLRTYESLRSRYNSNLADYNRAVNNYNSELESYKSERERANAAQNSFNAKVDEYNQLLEGLKGVR